MSATAWVGRAATFIAGVFVAWSVQADLVLVSPTTPPCPIVVVAQDDAVPAQLADKLAGYLNQMSGAKFETQRGGAIPTDRSIRLVVDAKADLPAEGYQWTCDERAMRIVARTDRGLAYGMYSFLEQVCGCRWWSHNEEDVPRLKTIAIKNMHVHRQPAFAMHDLFNREAQTVDGDFHFKSGADSLLQFTSGHSLYPLLNDYGKEHPEIYPADKNGKRTPNDLHLCYLAPGIAEALTAALDSEVQRRNGNVSDFIYFAGMGDWYDGQCQCDQCRAVYEQEKWTNPDGQTIPGYTGTLLRMINRTAEQLEQKYPGIQVGTFAYMSLEAPPAITKPRDNVVIRVPRLRHCTVHAADECEGNRAFYHNLVRWQQLAPGRVHVWDYGVNFTNFLLPFPTLQSISQNLKVYHELGIAGVMVQGNYVSTGGDAVVLKNYVGRKLLWEPERSVQELTEEFCRGYYGPAATDVLAYFDLLENSVRTPELKHADEFAAPRDVYLSEALIVKLRATLERALKSTQGNDNSAYERRVRELLVSVEAATLWKAGPLEERNGHLVRTDLGEDTYARALLLVEHCRSASPTEWGEGRAFRQQFLRMHGGPVATLQSKTVSVKAAPVQGGRIGPVTFQKRVVIDETSVQPGGGASIYEFDTLPTASQLTMRGKCGISNWGPATQHVALLKLSLEPAKGIAMTGAVQQKNNGAADVNSNVTTRYPAKDLKTLAIEWRDTQGKWTALELPPEKPSASCVGLTALRVKLPDLKVEVLDTYSQTEKNVGDLLADADQQVKAVGHYGAIEYDAKQMQLVTVVRVAASNISSDKPTPYLQRLIEFTETK